MGEKVLSCDNIFSSLKNSQILEFGSHLSILGHDCMYPWPNATSHLYKRKGWMESIVKKIVRLLRYQRVLTKPHFHELSVNESETYGLHFPENTWILKNKWRKKSVSNTIHLVYCPHQCLKENNSILAGDKKGICQSWSGHVSQQLLAQYNYLQGLTSYDLNQFKHKTHT